MPRTSIAILLAAGLSLTSAARAQDLPERVQEPARKKQAVRQAEQAIEEEERRGPVDSQAGVTYQQVMAKPDDVGLNYRYALSQIRKGNLRSAAVTLERILLVRPELAKVRLVHAVVLFRLDMLDEAERELVELTSYKMPAALRAQLEDYLRQIRKRRRRTRLNILLGAGFDYDDNRNAAPASGQRVFFDAPVTLDSNSTRQGDTAKTMLASIGLQHLLPSQADHRLFLDYSYYRAEQTRQRELNLQNHAVDAGATYRGWADVTATFEFDHLLLAQTTYLRSRGGRLRFDRKLSPRVGADLETAYVRQEYDRTAVVVTGDDRTGDRIEGSAGATFALTPTMSLSAGFTHAAQGALNKADAYRRESGSLGHSWLLGKRQFLTSSLTYNFDDYERPDPAVSRSTRRHDQACRARSTFGSSLGFLSGRLDDLVWLLTYEYYQARSNLTNYSYSNNKLSTMLTYKWEL